MREDIKKKVVFCEVAWMKQYRGVTDDDKPMNGGKYIEENGDGGEVYNFKPCNRKCYGYVMHYGDECTVSGSSILPLILNTILTILLQRIKIVS